MDVVSDRWESIISLFRVYIPLGSRDIWNQKWACSQILAYLAAFIDTLPWTRKYLKRETYLRNAQVNKATSVSKGIVKPCLIVVMIRKNWSSIAVAGCGLHYFASARFGSFWLVANFSTAERIKYVFHSYEN